MPVLAEAVEAALRRRAVVVGMAAGGGRDCQAAGASEDQQAQQDGDRARSVDRGQAYHRGAPQRRATVL
jgi:hypothetical protein